MYSLIRFLVFLILFLLICCLPQSRNLANKRKTYPLFAIICFALFAISHYFPVENAFHKFRTPTEIFSYTNFEELNHAIEGEESCMLVYPTNKNTYSVEFVGKDSDCYVLLPQHGSRMVSRKNDENGIIFVYHVEGTCDYYIVATFGEHASIEVHDESGQINTDIVNIDNSGLYYFYIPDLSDNHYLLLDGDKVTIYS